MAEPLPTFIIAVGIAGGTQMLPRFLKALGPDPDAAIIVARGGNGHDPNEADLSPARLAAQSGLSVRSCESGMVLEPGSVYLVDDDEAIDWRDSLLRVRPTAKRLPAGARLDQFFQAVSENCGEHCAAILEPDDRGSGSLGLEAAAAGGGLSMALHDGVDKEDTATAQILLTNIADVMGSPADLAKGLQAHLGNRSRHLARAATIGPQEIREVCQRVLDVTGHDFRHYKQSTLSRRIMRRLSVLRIADFDAYLAHLEDDPEEAQTLLRDLLVGVTAFFRDAQAFEKLRTDVLSRLIAADRDDPVRIWVAGCGRGQEAYSIAILAIETALDCGSTQQIQIFASDLDDRALSVARRGIYPAEAAEEIGQQRLEMFFERTGRRWRVSKQLREMIVFSPHNLIADPPFSRMDLISCRNVLIYLGPYLQKKLLSVFHYALNPEGYLFLGSSEAVTGYGDLFRVVDSRHQIAQRKATSVRGRGGSGVGAEGRRADWQPVSGEPAADLGAIAQRIVLDEFAPPFAIVNEDAQVMYLSAGAGAFLQPAEGQYVNHFVRMTRSSLRVGLRKTWNRALKIKRTATYEGLVVDAGNDRRRVRIVVQPMPELGAEMSTFMVVFHDLGLARQKDEATGTQLVDNERIVEQLEGELLRTREELERVVQDLESANEELKSSNEELISMNEELRSANEELASSKEEIQASSFALAMANADLVNLLSSTEIATIFLDPQGQIRNLTPLVSQLYNVTAADIGRPLTHFTPRDVRLPLITAADLQAVAVEPSETEITLTDGRTLLQRITPYRNSDQAVDGAVVTFIDISDQKRASNDLSAALAELEGIYQQVPVGLALIDPSLRYLRINEELAAINGVSAADHIGRTAQEIVPDLADQGEALMREVLAKRAAVGPFEIKGETPREPGVERTWLETWVPLKNDRGEVLSVLVTALDITDRKIAEQSLQRSRDELLEMTERAPVMLARLDAHLVMRFINPAFENLIQADQASVTGRRAQDVLPRAMFEQMAPAIARVLTGESAQIEFEQTGPNGTQRQLQISFAPEADETGQVHGAAMAVVDVTEQHAGWRMVAQNEQRLRRIIDNVLAFVGTLNTSGTLTEANEPAIVATGLRREDVVGKPFWDCYWWTHSPEEQKRLKNAVMQAALGKTVRYDAEIRVSGDQRLMIDFQISPVLDDYGQVIELIPSGVDISSRHAAQAELAASLQRLRQMMSAAQVGIAFGDATGRITQANEAMLRLLQRSQAEVERGAVQWDAHSLKQDQQANIVAIEKLQLTGRIEPTEKLLVRADETVLPVLVSAALTDSNTGEHVAFVVSLQAQRRAEAQARADRIALRKVYSTAPVGLAYFDAGLRYRFINEKLAQINGLTVDEHLGRTPLEVQPGLHEMINEKMHAVLSSGEPVLDLEIHEPADQRGLGEHWWLVNWIPDKDDEGAVVGMHVSVQEITDLKVADAHRELLLAELNHRVKNSLATIQAIASSTLRDATDPAVFRNAFMGRLRAIAAAHDILIGSSKGGVDVKQLVASQVGLFTKLESGRIAMDGPAVDLSAPVAHALGLVLHELATNAIKYGALSVEAGTIRIVWQLLLENDVPVVQIDWHESDGPKVVEPAKKGFGSRLIETSVSYSLGGKAEVHYRPEGVWARITVPVEADYE